WVDYLVGFNRPNYEGATPWQIGDGVTDSDGDRKPDTYALWFVADKNIPTGSPPMLSGSVELDSNGHPIDMGKHLMIVAAYGFANGREYREKFPSASRGYMRSGHGMYAGMASVLPANVGATGAPARGFTPVRNLTLLQQEELIRKRYIVPIERTNGVRWSNGYTFSYNVDEGARSDWVFISSVRAATALTRRIR